MSKDTERFLMMSFQDKVVWFKKKFRTFTKTNANFFYYDIIYTDLMCQTYELHKKTKTIAKNESSGFLLYVMDYFQQIIQTYNPNNGSWENFFLTFMLHRYHNYARSIKIHENKESVLIDNHLPFEYDQEQLDQDESGVAELGGDVNTKEINMLTYLFIKSFTARKNFFILLISCCVILSDSLISKICKIFCFDRHETFEIINKVASENDREKIFTRKEKLENRRNYNFTQALMYESRVLTSQNRDRKEYYYEMHNLNIKRLMERNQELSHIGVKADQNLVSSVLGLSRGSVSSSICTIKKQLSYCEGQNDNLEVFSKDIAESFKTGRWEYELKSMPPLSLFVPSKVFTKCQMSYAQ